MRRFLATFLGAVTLAVTAPAAAEQSSWVGEWAFSDCGREGCSEVTVAVHEVGEHLHAEVCLTPPRGFPTIWQEPVHLQTDGSIDIESGIRGMKGLETLVTLSRVNSTVWLRYRAMGPPNDHLKLRAK